MKDIDNETNLV